MRKAVLAYEEAKREKYDNLLKLIERIFQEAEIEVKPLCFESGKTESQYFDVLLAKDIDYICILDMVGFSVDTLMEVPAYNIVTAKQIHIVVDENVMSLYGHHAMALNLFLFLPGDMEKWQDKYLHIPCLNAYSPLETDVQGTPVESEHNRTVLHGIVHKVLEETEIS